MALTAAVSVNPIASVAGQSPPPMAFLTVANANAVAVNVTGVQLQFSTLGGSNTPSVLPGMVATGPGQNLTVPANGSLVLGPFPVVMGLASNANSFQAVNSSVGLNPTNPQGAEPPQVILQVGALVYGSDGSTNVAAPAGLTVSYSVPPPPSYQGGFYNFAGPNNFGLGLLMGVL